MHHSNYTFQCRESQTDLRRVFNTSPLMQPDECYYLSVVHASDGGTPRHIIRQLEIEHFSYMPDPHALPELMEEHFTRLTGYGVNVPSFEFQIHTSRQKRQPTSLTEMYMLVDYVAGQSPFQNHDNREIDNVPGTPEEFDLIIEGLRKYQEWSRQEKHVILDVFRPQQYLYGQNVAHGPSAPSQWWMVDVEPAFSRWADEGSFIDRMIGQYMKVHYQLYDTLMLRNKTRT